jgi:hypothetical protein
MSKNCKIKTKFLKEIITKSLEHQEKPVITDIVEIIRPYYVWGESELIERELKNKARYIMSTFKDEQKIRRYFLDESGVYINIENSTDLADLDKVSRQLKKKYNGLKGAINKVSNRIESVIAKYWAKSNKNV